jgi:hypothetical protein
MIILGLDQSITRTGWALYRFPGDERHMTCGSFSCSDEADAEAKCERFAREIKRLIGPQETRPDFICWERAANLRLPQEAERRSARPGRQ